MTYQIDKISPNAPLIKSEVKKPFKADRLHSKARILEVERILREAAEFEQIEYPE